MDAQMETMERTSFAEAQMQRFGWKKGQGLGKNNHGMAEALKVKQKKDTDGLGKEPDQFDFAWWDHVYNRAASNIVVDKDEEEKKLKKEEIIVTKRPTAEPKRVAAVPPSPLYQHFVSSNNALTSVDPDEAQDFSSQLTDDQLIEVCEGRRFGHRGGYSQGGKELRLQKQEISLKGQKKEKSKNSDPGQEPSQELSQETDNTRTVSKKKKKRKAQTDE